MKKYKRMLENASEIQYYMNIMETLECDAEDLYCVDGQWYFNTISFTRHCDIQAVPVPLRIVKFLIKGRTLKGGLSNPMSRYYGYKYLERLVEERRR